METKSGKTDIEISDFHNLFRPFVNRVYRAALILTNNPKTAEKLQTEIYLKAFMQYLQDSDVIDLIDFRTWLLQIIDDCFSTRKPQDSETLTKKIRRIKKPSNRLRWFFKI